MYLSVNKADAYRPGFASSGVAANYRTDAVKQSSTEAGAALVLSLVTLATAGIYIATKSNSKAALGKAEKRELQKIMQEIKGLAGKAEQKVNKGVETATEGALPDKAARKAQKAAEKKKLKRLRQEQKKLRKQQRASDVPSEEGVPPDKTARRTKIVPAVGDKAAAVADGIGKVVTGVRDFSKKLFTKKKTQ